MIERLKLVSSKQKKECSVTLHPDIVTILFEHRRFVKNIFLQIKGHHEIAYFGVNILNPENELISFSSMPHIEYNLIQQKLWKYDRCFSSRSLDKNTLYWWDPINAEALLADQIKEVKLTSNNFNAGVTLCRDIGGFRFLYSYATKTRQKDLQEYYTSQRVSLINIGDYFCKSLLDIYSEYCGNHTLPKLHHLSLKVPDHKVRSTLKLIVNNTYL